MGKLLVWFSASDSEPRLALPENNNYPTKTVIEKLIAIIIGPCHFFKMRWRAQIQTALTGVRLGQLHKQFI
jgi:hypothetical protein